MDLLTDGLLMAATLFAGGYCWVLSRRVSDLKSLDKGLGGSIVTLTRQVELARRTLDEAQGNAGEHRDELEQLVKRANIAASQLKMAVAAARGVDLPAPTSAPAPATALDAEPRQQAASTIRNDVAAAPVVPVPTVVDDTGNPVAKAAPHDCKLDGAPASEPLRTADVLTPRSDGTVRSTLKPPPPLAPPRTPDVPAILSDTDAAAASDWTAARSDRAAKAAEELAKPSSLPALASPLRTRHDDIESTSETDLIEALSFLAAGGSR